MGSSGSRVPVWLALPLMVLLGVAGYVVISYTTSGERSTTASVHSGSDAHTDHGPDSGAGNGESEPVDHGDHGDGEAPAGERPRALVLGGFAAINGAVLVSAAVLRHRGAGRRRGGAGRS